MANSPTFTLRMPEKDLADVREVAKVYGAPSTGAFIAEMVGVMCSGDAKRITEFNMRLMMKMGEQLSLDLVEKATREAKKRVKAGKRKASR